MPVASVSLTNLPGTEAAIGRAGSHCIIVDRPEGTFTARPIKAGEELVCDYAGMGHTEKDIAFNTGWFG